MKEMKTDFLFMAKKAGVSGHRSTGLRDDGIFGIEAFSCRIE
jgi:hypothetical protein